MGVSADKYIRGIGFYLFPYGYTVTARHTTNVCYPKIETFFCKSLMQVIVIFNFGAVNITINTDNRCNLIKRLCYFRFTKITGVPYLIPVRKVFFYLGIEVVMCVGY